MRPYEYEDLVHLAVSYEFNLNLYGVERDVYNVLDWLGDVGGLRDALFLIGAFVLFVYGKITGSVLDAYLLQSFYVKENKKARETERIESIVRKIRD